MLLTINYTGENTKDIGFLLHKNPSRPQVFELNYGKAYVFYPEVSYESTTVALLLDIDPIDLVRGKSGDSSGLFDYVNDRPYVSSSFLSTAISKVFGTAMTGRSKEMQQLADTPLMLKTKVHMLAASNKNMLSEIFEPLGYTVEVEGYLNDDKFLEWGNSKYITLTITGKQLLKDLLNHLYVLIPVFDTQKHYYISSEEIEKLFKHGEGWLKDHPRCEYITARYLNHRKSLIHKALTKLSDEETGSDGDNNEPVENKLNLNQVRLKTVLNEVKASGAQTVIDMGCGEGNLLRLLVREKQFTKVTATDVSFTALERLKEKLKVDKMHESMQQKLDIFQSSLTYRDARFSGFDCACVVEVIEHMEQNRLRAFERVLFEFARPKTAIITTPNVEYNINYVNMKEGAMRHNDHRFEWTREQLKDWATMICETYKYSVDFKEIGDKDEKNGAPTMMGVFKRCE